MTEKEEEEEKEGEGSGDSENNKNDKREGENKKEDNSDGEYNKVLPILGREITEALFDLLNFSQGPRVRDRVSHGEADPGSVSPSAAIFALHLSLLILSCESENHDNAIPRHTRGYCIGKNCCNNLDTTFKSSNKDEETIKHPILPHPPLLPSSRLSQETENALQVLREWISGYRSHYHPTALLHASLLSSTSLLSGWMEWKRVERSEMDYVEWERQVEVLVEEMDRLYERVEEGKGKSNVELEVSARKGDKERSDKEVDTENAVEVKRSEGNERMEDKEKNVCERREKKTREVAEYDVETENGKERTREVENKDQRRMKENTMINRGMKENLHKTTEERNEETKRTQKQKEEKEMTIRPKIKANLSYPSLSRTHTFLPLTKTSEFMAKIHNITFQVLHRPKSELEVISILRRITTNINTSLKNTQDSLSFKHTQFREKKMRSRRRETYKRQLNSVPVLVWTCYLSLQAVYMVLLSLHDVPEMRRDSFFSLMRVLKGMLKAMENLASQTDPQMNRWDEAVCLSRENVGFIWKHFGCGI
ncbi:Endoplasmic reticulum membrane-associated RNA degradation protein [Portunus trituberculatus]|uniref:Endoplasmic reticulum membrane-associated RNA degradation protein n=1 Tax=Portunus trituberculatus TaxID=210409 RepID=A0A5B7D798_PORTR|nr:Endoplasmic reticulum membrane-associated RNA degradation protein [Portunus trituberculatus]